MSENIVHTAVVDDCFRLAEASDQICAAFKEAAQKHRRFSHLGAITRWGDRFSFDLLERYRAEWDGHPEEFEHRLAFVLGWLCHRAADRQMKPVFRAADPNPPNKPTDCSIYHEAFIYHEVYARQADNPYRVALFEKDMQSLQGADAIQVEDVKELFRTLLQGALIELHTFIPDKEDIEGWFDRLFALQQRFYNDLDRYAEAIHRPDPDKVRRFIEEVNFYDAADPLIAAARAIQNGGSADPQTAFAAAPNSQYAQALHLGYGYLVSASEFFTGDMSVDQLKESLKIGEMGRDGKSV